ncbi:LysE/ArgO family amino acid transporter [Paenibacillus sp. OV219]|uniref:LysE/ArgO family amino acid transporter n=1 Tax=Paenibacillus sp. OV219 TaxID=1884377 RepID=UPI0008CFE110|nr:LysE/ArgO family amino acid transporter [Paenibacillus sp. OV219]SEO15994.1 L-lysine exporter family protein LysE/ArgO [Paenibacillus sp. OV219]
MIHAIINGFILAFGLILPLGVQNVFVFNQGAAHRQFHRVLPVIIAAALCDTLLISLAVFGVSAIVLGIYWLKALLQGVGILFLLYMGWVTWRSSGGGQSGKPAEQLDTRRQVAFALSVSLLNPHAILDTVGVIGTSSLSYSGAERIAFALVCIAVSWLWFTGLALAGRMIGSMDQSGRILSLLNKVSALVIWGTAIYLAVSLL